MKILIAQVRINDRIPIRFTSVRAYSQRLVILNTNRILNVTHFDYAETLSLSLNHKIHS